MRPSLFVVLSAILALGSPSPRAQDNTVTVAGTVVDPAGRALPDARVTVENGDFSTKRTVTTSTAGKFHVSLLMPGAYTLTCQAPNMVLKHPVHVTLTVGSSVEIRVGMQVAGASQSVTVHGAARTQEGNTVAPAMNKDDAAGSTTLAGMTVTYLPNHDRDFGQFNQLSAGVSDSPEGSGVVVAGQRVPALATLVDGLSFDDPLQGGARGVEDGNFPLPQTVVREFEIVRSGVTANVGETNAGLINIATKDGSNKLHGEAFYTGRPAALTSADAFGHSLRNDQNAFGGSVGGAIRRNRIFYYTGVEKDYVHAPYWSQFEIQPAGVLVPAALIAVQGQIIERSAPLDLFGRLDFLVNGKNTVNVEAGGNRLRSTNFGNGSTRTISTEDYASSLGGQSVWAKAALTTVLGGEAVNQMAIAWSGDHRNLTPNSTASEVVINGFGTLGGNELGPHRYTSQQLQLREDLALTQGIGLVRLGGVFANDPANDFQEANLNGRFDYNSLADYEAGRARRYQQTFPLGDLTYNGAVRQFSLYADLKGQLGRMLTVSAGLRWAAQWNPQPSSPNAVIPQTRRIPNDLDQWQPRLGVTWNPRPSIVVRSSAGIYTAPTPATLFHRVAIDNGTHTVTADSYFDPALLPIALAADQALASVPSGLNIPEALLVGIAPDFRNPRSFQTAVDVEKEINSKVTASAGYLRNSTWDLQRRVDLNLGLPVITQDGLPVFPVQRPNPSVGRLLVNESTAHSSYDGLLLSGRWQISRRSQVAANYTFSRTRDDDSSLGPFQSDLALDPYNIALDRAYSSMDVRNSFNLSAIMNLPYGFKVNPLLLARTGMPYTPITGFDQQGDANDMNDRASIGGRISLRNAYRQPRFANLDLRVVKDITLKGEGHHLDLFMDVFNLANASNLNFGPEALSFYGTLANPVFTAGKALFAPNVTRLGGPRGIQFTARLVAF
jgi:Carboxypeptidase regulatory-like domain